MWLYWQYIEIYIFIFLIGLCVGSFLNVCIYRIPLKKSIIFPSSFCPKCKKEIKWYDNIPVLSYLILKGQCRYCKEKISLIYPLTELLTGIGFLIIYLFFNLSFLFFLGIFLYSISIIMIGIIFKKLYTKRGKK